MTTTDSELRLSMQCLIFIVLGTQQEITPEYYQNPYSFPHEGIICSSKSSTYLYFILFQVANHFLAGLAIGGVYYHVSDDPEHAIQNR
jgi:hypothetical protein